MDEEGVAGFDVEEDMSEGFSALLDDLRNFKPNDRSNKDRYWAIVITELEKAQALWEMRVRGGADGSNQVS